ncbi:DNA mismatch repair protein [Mucilaginibacter corticis]|uniref:DNA mismatch repair protein n=2 Tax=Mucilaginibacter corticis TaxID=2597670 RepID=A0A556MXM6_9SPHI|nr:DNA mismatch repair protein [Mucilaginibacter corticis]
MVIINNEGIEKILKKGLDREISINNKYGFTVDKQTLADLNLLDKYKPNSVYSLFNQVRTDGGERLLREMFHHPLTNAEQINKRSDLFKFFTGLNIEFPITNEIFTRAENYLDTGTYPNYLASISGLAAQKIQSNLVNDERYPLLFNGLLATIEMLNHFRDFIVKLAAKYSNNSPYQEELNFLSTLFKDPRLQWLSAERNVQELPFLKVTRYDFLLKNTLRKEMEIVMSSLYHLDVYIAVSATAKQRNFLFANASTSEMPYIRSKALWHPSLIKGIPNPVNFNSRENLLFLTGANMAGKSTLMKAFGIAIYLAHMGFPVAAKDLEFSVMDGLRSSINVADDLSMGYSHFYAEVLRVKTVAKEVAKGKNLVILFDELFKGTNVKDAYDGTLAITQGFAAYRNCFFIISTHIVEVGEALKALTTNVRFAYLPTVMNGLAPQYTYRIEEGITADKQGMIIIQNEGVLDVLK